MNYTVLYYIFLLIGLLHVLNVKNPVNKTILLILYVYLSIGFAPIQTSYRGDNDTFVFVIYLLCFFSLSAGLNFYRFNIKIDFNQCRITDLFKTAYSLHLILCYLTLFYLFFTQGNIFLKQDLRLNLNPALAYFIRSIVFLPIIFTATLKLNRIRVFELFFYFVLPILPSILLGARGTAITSILSCMLILVLGEKKIIKTNSLIEFYKRYKKRIFFVGLMFSVFIIYGIFFIRRSGTGTLITSSDLLSRYFDNPYIILLLFLPLYLAFKETIGITTKIINEGHFNSYFDYPMVLAELFTILPGEQTAPGRIISQEIYKSILDKGYTPGLVGGLYMDFGTIGTVFAFFIIGYLMALFLKSSRSQKGIILYLFLMTTFLHLFHRGFLKPEYFSNFFILVIYLLMTKNENTSSSFHKST